MHLETKNKRNPRQHYVSEHLADVLQTIRKNTQKAENSNKNNVLSVLHTFFSCIKILTLLQSPYYGKNDQKSSYKKALQVLAKSRSCENLNPTSFDTALGFSDVGRLSPNDLHTIESFGKKGLTRDDAAIFFGLSGYEDFTPLEAEWFEIAYKRGLVSGKAFVVGKLMDAMSGKEATEACNAYLDRFMDGWKQNEPANGTNSQLPVIFNIGKDYDAKMVKPPIIPLLDEDE